MWNNAINWIVFKLEEEMEERDRKALEDIKNLVYHRRHLPWNENKSEYYVSAQPILDSRGVLEEILQAAATRALQNAIVHNIS